MSDAPERIWAWHQPILGGVTWTPLWHEQKCEEPAEPYIREADVEARVAEARNKGMQEAAQATAGIVAQAVKEAVAKERERADVLSEALRAWEDADRTAPGAWNDGIAARFHAFERAKRLTAAIRQEEEW